MSKSVEDSFDEVDEVEAKDEAPEETEPQPPEPALTDHQKMQYQQQMHAVMSQHLLAHGKFQDWTARDIRDLAAEVSSIAVGQVSRFTR